MSKGYIFESGHPREEGGGKVLVAQDKAAKTGVTLRRPDFGDRKEAHLHPVIDGQVDHSVHIPAAEGKLTATGAEHNSMVRARKYVKWYRNSRRRGHGSIPPEMIV